MKVSQQTVIAIICLAFASVLAWGVMRGFKDHFQPEFLDQTNVAQTQRLALSSYAQETNAVRPNGKFDAEPIQGMKSPFRVNMWDSYIP